METFEIQNTKFEIEPSKILRTERFKIGDTIKIWKKEYSDTWKMFYGFIVDFNLFDGLANIVICYFEDGHNPEIKIMDVNNKSTEYKIAPVTQEQISLSYERVMKNFEDKILTKEQEITDTKKKRDYFVKLWNKNLQ